MQAPSSTLRAFIAVGGGILLVGAIGVGSMGDELSISTLMAGAWRMISFGAAGGDHAAPGFIYMIFGVVGIALLTRCRGGG